MINTIDITNFSSAQILGAYNCGAYGADAYNTACTTGADTTGGGLADTGYNILLPLALGLALIIAATILLVKRLKRRHSQATK